MTAQSMETTIELPECPVCMQTYDNTTTVPRVLPCGHTTCEDCLKNIPQSFPNTIRCPACTQLVRYPSSHMGPSSLPKNIDLLRVIPNSIDPFSDTARSDGKKSHNDQKVGKGGSFMPSLLWSDEFYSEWRSWVLDEGDVLVEEGGSGVGILREGKRKVRLLKVFGGLLSGDGEGEGEGGVLCKVSYAARVMSFLYGRVAEEERKELRLILGVGTKQRMISQCHGFWGGLEDGGLCLVFGRFRVRLLDKLGCFEDGFSGEDSCLSTFAMMGMEICEAVIGLHMEGLVAGCLGLSCFEFDDFGRVHLSMNDLLVTGRSVRENIMEASSSWTDIRDANLATFLGYFLKREVFLSPETLFELLVKEGMDDQFGSLRYLMGYTSDIWSLGFALLRLIIGQKFVTELVDFVDHAISVKKEGGDFEFSSFYTSLVNKVCLVLETKLGEEFISLQKVLLECLNIDPMSRPLATDIWKCIRELVIQPQFDTVLELASAVDEENKGCCLVLGEICSTPKRNSVASKEDNESQEEGKPRAFVELLVEKKLKSKDMQGHLDSVTGLAIGGGYLFSASYDKTIRVWSLQNFSHMHTFKGHEHKVMAVIFVDEGEPLCISGDSGSGIFVWSISVPIEKEPLKKWYEQKDWRYSGIHALTTAGNGFLYTGSGDRLIKAWSLKDGSLSYSMEGHKSVVSTLAAVDGVLYSGSWDGTIRLWSLNDHSLLTVLGEDVSGTVPFVLSLTATRNLLVAGHDNGFLKVWRNDVLMKSSQLHDGAIFAIYNDGNRLFTGGWDKTINLQELSGDECQLEFRPIGSIPCDSVVTSLLSCDGKLFIGYGDRTIKVFY